MAEIENVETVIEQNQLIEPENAGADASDDVLDPDGKEPERKDAGDDQERDPSKRGLINDVRKERERRRTAEAAYQQLSEKLDRIEKRLPQSEKAGAETEDEEDRLLTVKELKKLRQEERAADEEASKRRQIDDFQRKVVEAEQTFKAELEDSGVPPELDYDAVVEAGREDLSPNDWRKIQASENPAKTAYDLCLKRNEKLSALSARLGKKGKGSVLLGGGKGGKEKTEKSFDDLTPDDVENLSDEDLEKLARGTFRKL